jgi:competence protein ComEA
VTWVERTRGHILVVIINLSVTLAAVIWLRLPPPSPVQLISPPPSAAPEHAPTATQGLIRVYVAGAVVRPDVYRLAPDSIVKDAIQAAGGATAEADLPGLNLAQQVRDQERVYVPRVGEASAPPAVSGGSPTFSDDAQSSARVNINTATVEQLAGLPGIGPVLAQRIIDYRTLHGPFTTVQDITQVPGIGDAILEKIKDRITVDD